MDNTPVDGYILDGINCDYSDYWIYIALYGIINIGLMSIERTFTVKRSDAIDMLKYKKISFFEDDSNSRLANLLYLNRESETENYDVVDDVYVGKGYEHWKLTW